MKRPKLLTQRQSVKTPKGRFTHRMPFPCRAAKGLECVFPIRFTQCSRVWFTLAMPCSDHAVLLKATSQHGRREALRRTACYVWIGLNWRFIAALHMVTLVPSPATDCTATECLATECLTAERPATECLTTECLTTECLTTECPATECLTSVRQRNVWQRSVWQRSVWQRSVRQRSVWQQCTTTECLTTECPAKACLTTECPATACLTTECPASVWQRSVWGVSDNGESAKCLTTECPAMECLSTECPATERLKMECLTTECLAAQCPLKSDQVWRNFAFTWLQLITHTQGVDKITEILDGAGIKLCSLWVSYVVLLFVYTV